MTDRRSTSPQSQAEMLRDIASRAAKIRDNAADLLREAQLLRSQGALSRALFLHQISMEECAKVEMLGAWAIGELAGQDTDRRKFFKTLASHKAKNSANAYFLPPAERERLARDAGDWKAALEAFDEHRDAFHEQSNLAKNSALYVDVKDGACSAPSEHITEAMVDDFAARNIQFLSQADNSALVLSRWSHDGAAFAEIAAWSIRRAAALTAAFPDDPNRAVAQLLEEGREKLLGLTVNQVDNDA